MQGKKTLSSPECTIVLYCHNFIILKEILLSYYNIIIIFIAPKSHGLLNIQEKKVNSGHFVWKCRKK